MPCGSPMIPPVQRPGRHHGMVVKRFFRDSQTEKIMLDTRWALCAILFRSACEVKRTAKQFAASGFPKLRETVRADFVL